MNARKRAGVSSAMIAETRAAGEVVKSYPTIITDSSPGVVLERARSNMKKAIAINRRLLARFSAR